MERLPEETKDAVVADTTRPITTSADEETKTEKIAPKSSISYEASPEKPGDEGDSSEVKDLTLAVKIGFDIVAQANYRAAQSKASPKAPTQTVTVTVKQGQRSHLNEELEYLHSISTKAGAPPVLDEGSAEFKSLEPNEQDLRRI